MKISGKSRYFFIFGTTIWGFSPFKHLITIYILKLDLEMDNKKPNTLITKKFGRKNFGREIFGRFFSKFRTISDKISDKISDSYIQKPAKFGQKMWK